MVVSQWTWAATLLQSSNVAWQYGVSGPFWYAAGKTIQVILFGVLAISLKKVAPSAHTVCEIVNARWGQTAHITFLIFAFMANVIVTSMLLLGGSATVEALTGMNRKLASFLIPWGVILYTAAGGLKATFIASYLHTVIIFAVLILMTSMVYICRYSSGEIYDFLENTVSHTKDECEKIYSYKNGTSFYVDERYVCGKIPGNNSGSYLTMLSADGLMFGIINIVGNFGTVFVDQSYWQSAIAAKPTSASKGYLLGGICWFAIPFCLATSLGLASTALMLPITKDEAGAGLVPPAVATHLLGDTGSILILTMLFMAIVSTGSAESIAVSSLVAYDIYRQYFNPDATGDQILFVSRIVIVVFGLIMGVFSVGLDYLGLDLGWIFLFMGICIGSAVIPLWNMMTWDNASGKGAVYAAWGGLFLGILSWLIMPVIQNTAINVDNLGKNEAMLTGNLFAIISSGIIHYIHSQFFPQDFHFNTLDSKINLVENSTSGLSEKDLDPEILDRSLRWIKTRGWFITFMLIIVWPLASIPAGKFTKKYFAFWVFVSISWGLIASLVITLLPLWESRAELSEVIYGIFNPRGIELIPDDYQIRDGDTDESRDEDENESRKKPIQMDCSAIKSYENIVKVESRHLASKTKS